MKRRWTPALALVLGGGAILLLALWLRNPLLPYGGDVPGASGRPGAPRNPAANGYESEARERAISALRAALTREERRLRTSATRALDAPAGVEQTFHYLADLGLEPAEGVVLFDNNVPAAWTGSVVVDPATALSPTGVTITPFYTAMTSVAQKGTRRAVATALIHAEAPADRLAQALDAKVEGREELVSYMYSPAGSATGEAVLTVRGGTLLRADAVPLPRDMVRFGRVTALRVQGTLLLCAGMLVLLGVVWRDRKFPGERILAITICLIAITLVQWSNLSNTARAFDPTYYYSSIGGPLTANAGVLLMTAVLMLLAVYAIVRSRRFRPPRLPSLIGSLFVGVAGVALVVAAAQGIAYPVWGTTASLWLSWEVPLFVVLFAFLLAAAWLGRVGLGHQGTIHIRVAAAIAIVAGFFATALVWRVTTAERLDLVAQDIQSLQRPDADAVTLLRRFATELSHYDTAGTRADLLKRYAVSDLAAAGLPASLATWTASGARHEELRLAAVKYDSTLITPVVMSARESFQPVIVQTLGDEGRQVIMAVQHRDGEVTSAVVAPRTQLIPADPFVSLLGLSSPIRTDPPYTLRISDVPADARLGSGSIQWTRIGDELHGDRLIETSRGIARAHAEVDLRSFGALGERTVLIVILDVAIAGLLWAVGAMVEGGFLRWLRARSGKWLRSYHGRLTLALSAFFIIPALAFAFWSYQRLRNDDREVRDLLVRETLDAVVAAGDSARPSGVARPYDTPLFLYSSGLLNAASDSLLDQLAPAGRALPRPVHVNITAHGELNASWQQNVGETPVLFGYRAASGPARERYVLAAPARSDELSLDRRRRDLAILVLFATVMGALAALWLSRIAAKRLARDLELSRIEVARAERVLAWGEMARQVAHEIKNPLTPIRLGVQHLRRARTDRRVDFDRVLDENVTRILSEIDRLDEIARAFSRYGSAPSELPPPESIDVAAILRDVVALERMGVGDVTWTLAGAEGSVIALARVDELRDVLLNVFENARLARARKVAVTLRETPKTVEIEISDDGRGIAQTALPRVFEPHFSTRTTGSGLGLAISRRLLESWGATIEIDSEEGKGARVLLSLQSPS